jgi:hypothetical protein
MKIREMLAHFIKTATGFTANEWLYAEEMMLYVRKGRHYIEGKPCITLDLASFEVYKRGEGTFTTFVQQAHADNPWEATYVECVHNRRLGKWLERHGFHREPDSEPGNYFLWKHEKVSQ